ncbi:hypothetical protein LJC68_07990 [Bacteroidales bacterium OttesenSCG-928-B11]|nr:hypothetical protein [Bacteroidales bacterium OttesenSCG-928-B11]MDL2326434.1 hypothetical protein [Bacteroidales bacterium OttesenSCG-928-A14]
MSEDFCLDNNELTDDERQVIYHVTLKSYEISTDSLKGILPNNHCISDETIHRTIKKLQDSKLISSTDLWGEEHIASDDLLLYIIPELKKFKKYVEKIQLIENEDTSQPSQNRKAALKRNLLFSLLFNADEYKYQEEKLLPHPPADIIDFYCKILTHEKYTQYIRNIEIKLINICLDYRYNQLVTNLFSIKENSDFFFTIRSYCSAKNRKALHYFDDNSPLFTYNHAAYNEKNVTKAHDKLYNKAIIALFSKNADKALGYFTKGLQAEKKGVFPQHPVYAMWYFITLHILPSEIAQTYFNTIRKPSVDGKNLQNKLWNPIISHFLNDRESCRQQFKELDEYLLKGNPIDQVIYIIVNYLTGKKLACEQIPYFIDTIIGCHGAGYEVLAYESAFALLQLTADKRCVELFDNLESKLQVAPVLQLIKHEEPWRKNTKLLYDLLDKTRKTNENFVKISYLFNKEKLFLQLAIQNKTDKGWSKMRKIAHKNISGIDPQTIASNDFKIINALKLSANSTCNNIQNIIPEIINHPNIFSDGTNPAPVLFIPGRIEIEVIKNGDCYDLAAKPHNLDHNFFIDEIAKNIYKIYSITEAEKKIVRAIQNNHLTFPVTQREELQRILYRLGALNFEIVASEEFTQKSDGHFNC